MKTKESERVQPKMISGTPRKFAEGEIGANWSLDARDLHGANLASIAERQL